MNLTSNRILNLSDSQTLAMAQLSRELKAKGIDIISLSIGEPDFDTPLVAKEAAKKAIDENYSHYSPITGYDELKDAIIEKLRVENKLAYKRSEIIVSNGAKQSLVNVMLSIVNPGDEVIIPAPYWVSYLEFVRLAEGHSVILPTTLESDFKINPDQLEKSITPRTKAILLNSPSNPTGSIYTHEELEALAVVLRKYPNIFVISDEIYEHINFMGAHTSIAELDGMKERTGLINGVSKGYAMTGWRIGYLAGPEWLVKACNKIQGQTTSGACSVSQMASVAAIRYGKEESLKMNQIFKKRCDLVYQLMKEIPGFEVRKPMGAFYLFPRVEKLFGKKFKNQVLKNDDDLCMYFLDQAHVALVPGSAFGSPECIRISYATSEDDLIKAMARIKKAVDLLHD